MTLADRIYRRQASSSSLNEWSNVNEWNNRSAPPHASRENTSDINDHQGYGRHQEPRSGPHPQASTADEPKSSGQGMDRSRSTDVRGSSSQGPKKWGLRAFLRVEKTTAALKSSEGRVNELSAPGSEQSIPNSSALNSCVVSFDREIQAPLNVHDNRTSETSDSGRSNIQSDSLSLKHGMGSAGGAQARLKGTKKASLPSYGLSFLEQQLTEARESIIEEEDEESERSKPGSFDLKGKTNGRLSSDSDWDVGGALSKLAPASRMDKTVTTSNDSDKAQLTTKVSAPFVPPSPASSLPYSATRNQTESMSLQLDLGTRMQSIASHLNAMTDEDLMDPTKSSDLSRTLMGLAKNPLPPSADAVGLASNDLDVQIGNGSHDGWRNSGVISSGANVIGASATPGRGSKASGSNAPSSSSMRGRLHGPLDSLSQLIIMSESQQSRNGETDSQAANASRHRPPQRRFTATELLQQRILVKKIEGSTVGGRPVESRPPSGANPHIYPLLPTNDIIIGTQQRSGVSSRASSLSQTSLAQRAAAAAVLKQLVTPLGTVQEGAASGRVREEMSPRYSPSGSYLPQVQGIGQGGGFR